MLAQPSKTDERGDLGPICTDGLNNCNMFSPIVLHKMRVPAALANYVLSRFITANKKVLFVHFIYFFALNIVLDYLIKKQ